MLFSAAGLWVKAEPSGTSAHAQVFCPCTKMGACHGCPKLAVPVHERKIPSHVQVSQIALPRPEPRWQICACTRIRKMGMQVIVGLCGATQKRAEVHLYNNLSRGAYR